MSLPVSIKLTPDIKVFPISIPLKALEQDTDYTVKLPIQHFFSTPLLTTQALKLRLEKKTLPLLWSMHLGCQDSLLLCKMSLAESIHVAPVVQVSLRINEDLSWSVSFVGRIIPPNAPSMLSLPPTIKTIDDMTTLLDFFANCQLCCGSKEEKLLNVIKHKDSTLQGQNSATIDTSSCQPTVRHRDCHYLLPPSSSCVRCPKCTRHRSSLLIQSKRLENSTPSKKTNYRFLSKQGLVDRVQLVHSQVKVMTKRNLRLKKKLETQFEENGMTVSEETHNDLATVIERNSDIVDSLPPNSFQRLFWEQQLIAMSKPSSKAKGVRYHPLMIRWCLYLQYHSSGAYNLLRESGILKLPSSRTLRDYTHFASAKRGFSVEVDKMLIDASKVASCPEREKYVLLLLDEMHVKEDLIFNKHSGELIGFSNLGDINNHLEVYLRSLDTDIEQSPPLAKSVMVFMVRGLFTKMQFAYAQFLCCSLTGDKLYAPFWNALSRIENCGLKVLGVTMDGCAVNRRFMKSCTNPPTHFSTKSRTPTPQRVGQFFSSQILLTL
ncbi:uncharacterized protein LOC135347608 [Halichondria panicea]|uniref:uncharacterized protein LOC135347608 n=1 Tax=Halichondria panicea TaxID=6063 RepID=UPI00312B32A7